MLYILLPVYNEDQNLRALIRELHGLSVDTTIRVIAVNDGSTDNSLAILKSELRETDVICSHAINMNIGVVFSEGIREFLMLSEDEDVLVIMESDRTTDVRLVKEMYRSIKEKEVDVVIASRFCDGGSFRGFPFLRKLLSYGANWTMRFLFPISGVREYSLFCRAYSWVILNEMKEQFGLHGMIQSKSFFSNVELLVKMAYLTERLIEIPAVYDYGKKKGPSKMRLLLTIVEYLTMIRTLRHSGRMVKLQTNNTLE